MKKRLSELKPTVDKTDPSVRIRNVRERVKMIPLGGGSGVPDKKGSGVTKEAARGLGAKKRR